MASTSDKRGQSTSEAVRAERAAWAKRASRSGDRRETFRTSALDIDAVYTSADVADADYLRDLGFPGEYPFTRGVQPNMYRGRLWTMRQYAGFGTPAETNERFNYLLGQGQTGLSTAFDLPTQLGYDSDDEHALGEVGKVGVAIDSLRDMEIAFRDIPLDKVSTSMTINAPAALLVAMYVAVGEQQGVQPAALTGTAQNDVLKEYVARGTYIFPPGPTLRLSADLVGYCSREMPRFNSISISGYHIRDAGSTAVQEMAFTLSNAIAYGEAFVARGVRADAWGPRVSWIFNAHNNFFEEVAKFRALRRMWAQIMHDRFGAQDPRSWALRTHSQTGGSTLTAQQPTNNIVRAAYQAMAAVLGGVQSLALSTFDEALALPTDEAQRIALRTQQVLANETGVADTVDPLGGSYYVESLTSRLEEEAWRYIRQIEDMGGAVSAIDSGFIQTEIARAAYEAQRAIEDGGQTVVGVNSFTEGNEDQGPAIFRVDDRVVGAQRGALAAIRDERNAEDVQAALEELRAVAASDGDLMPPILRSVKTYATTGEICGVLREVFGEYEPPTVI